ncbi:MAG: pentapeptide repeat-containing protein [Chloroflexota bacterium]
MTQTTTGIQRIANDYGTAALIVGVLLVFGLLPFGADFMGYSTNIYTELISVAVTILILDRRAQRREEVRRADEKAREAERQREERIARIIREMRSPFGDVAADAVKEALHLFKDGTFEGNNSLWQVNLSGHYFEEVQLAAANLYGADLSKAFLLCTSLKGAILTRANLTDATLILTDLSNANLTQANLTGATLEEVNIIGAIVYETIT